MRFRERHTNDQSAIPADGVVSSIRHMASAGGRYVGARARLLLLEARLAAGDLKGSLVLCIIAAAGFIAGLILLMVAVVLWVARFFMAGDTALASGVIGIVLLGAGFLLVWCVRRSLGSKDLFPVTKSEFNLNTQWLHELREKPPGSNGKL